MMETTFESDLADLDLRDEESFEPYEETQRVHEITKRLMGPWPMTPAEYERLTRRLCALKTEADAVKANAKSMVNALESDIESLIAAESDRIKEYIASHAKKGARSVRTLHGTIGLVKVNDQVKVVDKDKALVWAKLKHPELVVTTESVAKIPVGICMDWAEMNPDTGECYITPQASTGLEVIPAFDRIEIRPVPRGSKPGEGE